METVGVAADRPATPETPEATYGDRRGARRFPIECEVRYRIVRRNTIEAGSGRTINMSSTGILFTTQHWLAVGQRIEVAVDWPVLLDDRCALKLVAIGDVVRSERASAAIAISRHEFRTRGAAGALPRN